LLALTLEELSAIIAEFDTVMLSAEEPLLKTALVSQVTNFFLDNKRSIFYIDCDLQYSSWLAQQEQDFFRSLKIIMPLEESVVDSIISMISNVQYCAERGIIVLDSLNMLQTMLRRGGVDAMTSNRQSATIITLLQQFAESVNSSLVITNLTRQRPPSQTGVSHWDSEMTGGRMAKIKSELVVSIAKKDESELLTCSFELTESSKKKIELPEKVLIDLSGFILR
jgi:hypothetical protein